MSSIGDLITEILADVVTAQSSYTAIRGLRSFDQIPADQIPVALAFNPIESADQLDHLQSERTVTINVALVDLVEPGSAEQATAMDAMLTVLDSVQTQLEADRTLNGKADRSWVSARSVNEHPDSGRIVGLLEVTAEIVS